MGPGHLRQHGNSRGLKRYHLNTDLLNVKLNPNPTRYGFATRDTSGWPGESHVGPTPAVLLHTSLLINPGLSASSLQSGAVVVGETYSFLAASAAASAATAFSPHPFTRRCLWWGKPVLVVCVSQGRLESAARRPRRTFNASFLEKLLSQKLQGNGLTAR